VSVGESVAVYIAGRLDVPGAASPGAQRAAAEMNKLDEKTE
jgi:hypothetical protein